MVRIAVLVSGGGTNLQALLDSEKRGENPYGKIVLVISGNKKAYALQRAKKAGVETMVIRRRDYQDTEGYDKAMLKALKEHGIEEIILAGFLNILSSEIINAYPQRIINVHPSLIPSFCGKGYYGLKVHEAALRYGVKVTGATVHYVNEIPDGGQIIYQKAVEVKDGDTPEILQRRVMEQAEWILLPKAAAMVAEKIEKEKNNADR
ncbi:MAG: phosphoribosylglycinamide formyltransferase [Solobacterium sp.]|jgi:phosphoribosylglycinamide formyltransferase-1|nr:phosphoribosylglycinamide formyltransferase [Solobacterium sp.]MCH4048793.1 phosphoribosylglycinamide formyltransferase [Solobacterium sp.]MCH4074453.1 phosphoribosylglycinamide formyltransferase [Solobacterium sp.]MCI1314035.1 phosphoribosylglycinamide formyltransferase [Solobacterium sp.]MCI1346119.1 phosphoribosylglycinamide formyltransferase [Solobacterium sp.]